MKAESTVRFIGLFVFVFIFFITPLHAEEGTVKAMSAWQSQGKLFKVGENKGYFMGAFGGIMFIHDKKVFPFYFAQTAFYLYAGSSKILFGNGYCQLFSQIF